MDGLRAAVRAITIDIRANAKIGLGLMLFGIRSQLTILVIMLVSSTGAALGLACVYIHTYRCTYPHTGMSDNKSEMIICYNEKGGAIYNMTR